MEKSRVRHSEAEEASLIKDPIGIAKREASNSLRQAEHVREYIIQSLDGERPFKLRPSILLDLNRCAIEGLSSYAGVWRPAGIKISQSKHTPPDGHQVPELVEDICDYVNENWSEKTAIHLACVVMWRMNWIHPFTDGNGRTSRAASYLVLCTKLSALLPGRTTIPEQIVENRNPYYEALETADLQFEKDGKITDNTVLKMEELLSSMLSNQLVESFNEAKNEI